MPAALRLGRLGLFKLKFWLLQPKPTAAPAALTGCAGLLPPPAQLVLWMPAAAARTPLRAFTLCSSADGSTAPLSSPSYSPLLWLPPHLNCFPKALASTTSVISVSLLSVYPSMKARIRYMLQVSTVLVKQPSVWGVHPCCLHLWRSKDTTINWCKRERQGI